MRSSSSILFLACVLGARLTHAFVPSGATKRILRNSQSYPLLLVSLSSSSNSAVVTDSREESFILTDEQVKPLIRLGSGDSEKVVNAFGLWCAAVSILTGPIWSAVMATLNLFNKWNGDWDPDRAIYDKTGKIWAKTWLSMTGSFPTITGDLDRLKENSGPCLFVANHASWLDIPVLCTVLDPVFKFIAKGELRKVPCIGQQLAGGNHILIDREDRRSQLRTFKQGIGWLKKGVPLMAFPEGMRSKDGRLMDFKGGLFSMAVKTQVPIVPISISHTHAVMPGNALFPVQRGAGRLHVHIHDQIDTTGRNEAELGKLVRESFLSKLPFDQHPLPVEPEEPTTIEVNGHAETKVQAHTQQHATSNVDVSVGLPTPTESTESKVKAP